MADTSPPPTSRPADSTSWPRFAVIDIETSGLRVAEHSILQVAVVTVDHDTIVDEWSSLIRLASPLEPIGAQEVHGLQRQQLLDAPPLDEVLAALVERIREAVIVAHNIDFDWPFVAAGLERCGHPVPTNRRLCTLKLSRSLDPQRTRGHRLSDACARYGIINERAHDALGDARATAALLPCLLAARQVASPDQLVALYEPE